MLSRYSRVASLAVLSIVSVAGLGAACNSSPFLAAQFNTSLANFLAGNPPTNPPTNTNDNSNSNSTVVNSVCDLDAAQRTIQIQLLNSSPQNVEFSMTLVVSAGPGGFVCDDEVPNYISAGYTDAIIPGSGANLPIGCDTITLLSGTRLLTLEYGSNQGAAGIIQMNPSGDDSMVGTPLTLRRRDNGITQIPLPELIVFGSDDPEYVCTGGAQAGDLCSQRGFRYLGAGNITVGTSPDASHIQGTVCAENAGTAPEWRLDKTLDTATQPFQFGRGGAIVVRVLNRSNDIANTRNQVVWTVVDANGDPLHFEDP